MNMSNTTTLMPSRSTISTPLIMLLRRSSTDILTTTTTSTLLTDDLILSCPPDRWGSTCENICKPCGLGVCHPTTGKCICPTDIYGEFCDLWKGKTKI